LRDGTLTRRYTFGHSLISQTQLINNEWQTSYYGYDGHGSTRLLTDTTGQITDTYDYDAFGNLIASTGTTPNEHLYAGEALDSNSGLYYLRARYMNPASGRFISMDSYGGSYTDPASLHKYSYANGNPANLIDPSGNFSIVETAITSSLVGTLSGATIGLLTGGIKGAITGAVQGAVLGALVPITGAGVGVALLGNAARGVFITGLGVGIGSTGVNAYEFATAGSGDERFGAGVNLIAGLGFMYFGPKILERVNTRIITGDQANIDSATRGYTEPPWDASGNVTETTLFAPAKYVRVYANGRLAGAYVMEASEIQGLTPAQIQQKFALPVTPDSIAIADVPAGTTIRIGTAGANGFAPSGGGGIQVELQNKNHPNLPSPPTNFHSGRPL